MDRQDFRMFIDSSLDLEITVENVLTLEGATIDWMLAKSPTSEALIVKSTDNSGEIDIDETIFTVHILPADNIDLAPGVYYHEARVTDTVDNSMPVISGKVAVIESLTKRVEEEPEP